MKFAKTSLEINPYFLDWRKTITGLVGLSELSSLVDDVLGLQDCLRVIIRTVYYFSVYLLYEIIELSR